MTPFPLTSRKPRRPLLHLQQLLLTILILSHNLSPCCSKLHSSPDTTTGGSIQREDDAASAAVPTFTLLSNSNNITIPLIGLGSASGVAFPHILTAIQVGYRFIDTAQSHSWGYREEDVGQAVFDLKRRWEDHYGHDENHNEHQEHDNQHDEHVFVQTKIHPQDLGYQSTRTAIQLSLQRLQSSTLDSILIHKPHCWAEICPHGPPEGTWHDSWMALQEAVEEGLVRLIGMCDVDLHLLAQLLQKKREGQSIIIQNWFDPFHQDVELRREIERINNNNNQQQQHEQHGQEQQQGKILYQGYSTLGTQWFHHKGYSENPVLNHPTLKTIAEKYGATVPQVVIQWATRKGVMVLPASRNRMHQLSNLNSFFFTLSEEETRSIDDLDGKPPPPPPSAKREIDPNEVQVKFVNKANGTPINVYWVTEGKDAMNEDNYVNVGEMKEHGDALGLTSYHGHTFLFRESGGNGKRMNLHVVNRALGGEQNHEIEDRSGEL